MSGSTARKTARVVMQRFLLIPQIRLHLQGSAKALVPEFRRCAAGKNEDLLRFGESIGPYLRNRNPTGKGDMQFGNIHATAA